MRFGHEGTKTRSKTNQFDLSLWPIGLVAEFLCRELRQLNNKKE
jgi:hypothetical protein